LGRKLDELEYNRFNLVYAYVLPIGLAQGAVDKSHVRCLFRDEYLLIFAPRSMLAYRSKAVHSAAMLFDLPSLQVSSLWERLLGAIGDVAGNTLGRVVEAIRTLFEGDPETRRRVSFSVAIIALSAKMAKADGIVNDAEVRAFQQIFDFPDEEAHNVARLYNLARQDVAGYEAYASRLANLCSGEDRCNCEMLESVIDGLFHIAKADGLIHERELMFLAHIAEIFKITEDHFDTIMALRHRKIFPTSAAAIISWWPNIIPTS
jgi:uncharacterized tellurite resistance protein B-like protein